MKKYTIDQTQVGEGLTLAKVKVIENGSSILEGDQYVCLPVGDGVTKYIEDVYLFDQRRQPGSVIADISLPCDSQT